MTGNMTLFEVKTAFSSKGEIRYQLVFIMENPNLLVKEEIEQGKTVEINFPGKPQPLPFEHKAIINLLPEEWEKVKDKYIVGKEYIFSLEDGKMKISSSDGEK